MLAIISNGIYSCLGAGSRFMHGGAYGMRGRSDIYGYGGFGMYRGIGMIAMAVFTLIVIAAIIYFVKKTGHRKTSSEAMLLLNNRFANGEISEEEYLKKKKILG